MRISESIMEMTEMTHGRIHAHQVFRDFIAFFAYHLSNRTDPVHLDERSKHKEALIKQYRTQEIEAFIRTLLLLTDEICRNLQRGSYIDVLGPIHQQFYPKSGPLKQDFTPPDVASLVSRLSMHSTELPETGYFTCMEPTCGSGVLCLAAAEEIANRGYNPCEQLVIQASDLDGLCAQMTYIQLSLYGIPAVIIRGDTITLEEYDRWYTPLYILRNWVWRQPMPFRPGRNKSDELLKMACEPWYAKARYLSNLLSATNQKKIVAHG